jgi:DNA modification methylase
MVKAIKNSSKQDDIILDLFGGSGSTLIAAEQTNRVCYMMELDPKYCDVIRTRYENFIQNKEKQ